MWYWKDGRFFSLLNIIFCSLKEKHLWTMLISYFTSSFYNSKMSRNFLFIFISRLQIYGAIIYECVDYLVDKLQKSYLIADAELFICIFFFKYEIFIFSAFKCNLIYFTNSSAFRRPIYIFKVHFISAVILLLFASFNVAVRRIINSEKIYYVFGSFQ